MTADIARVTYDPSRQYRAVIAQQGRVTLEADSNESSLIASEALRLETIDVIGPTGTPDDGYKVGSGKGAGGVSVGAGTLYLGGWRLELDAAVDLSHQPDWLNAPAFDGKGNLAVALLLNEQSVCAVEDQALREVALGGPDSAARTRLMQHFLRIGTDGSDCPAGAAAVLKLLSADGLTIDSGTLQLLSSATLQAGFVPGPPSDTCTPAAAGGYLGADNQLIRVTVIAYDSTARTGTLLWGWNNASLLYRATMTDPLTLTLVNTPVDVEHAPQLGQAVEILRTQADLGDNNYIAAAEGFVTTLAQAYSFDTGTIALNDALPAEYQQDKNPLFVRLWQAKVPFAAGKATALDGSSGVTVAITLPALPTHIGLRPFWRFAVRPSMPVKIYPQRYFDSPQPPDGPRQWLTGLGVVQPTSTGSTLLADCRTPFLPLTKQGGKCCCLVLGPNEVAGRGGLQAVMNSLAGTSSCVALLPGTYNLSAPLLLTKQHAGLTLEACDDGVILAATGTDLRAFLFGLVLVDQAAGICLRGLTFTLPNVTLGATGAAQPTYSIGVLAVGATNLCVEACTFNANPPSVNTYSAGLFALGDCSGLKARRNTFAAAKYQAGMIFGILATVLSGNATATIGDAEITDNVFQRLPGGVVAYAQLGVVRCSGNRVIGCGTGLFFAASNLAATGRVAQLAMTQSTQQPQYAELSRAVSLNLQAPMLADIVTNAAPFATRVPPPGTAGPSNVARDVLVKDVADRGAASWSVLSASIASPATMTGAPVTASAASAAAPAAPAQQTASASAQATADTRAMQQALILVQNVGIDAEIVGYTQRPVLHIAGNDITLVATGTTPGIGIGVVFSPRDEAGTLLLTANRVMTADSQTVAAGVLFPAVAAVTGNVLIQNGAQTDTSAPALGVVSERTALVEVVANVVHAKATVVPPRATSAPTSSWNFLNTVG
jgi:hypothetical protein